MNLFEEYTETRDRLLDLVCQKENLCNGVSLPPSNKSLSVYALDNELKPLLFRIDNSLWAFLENDNRCLVWRKEIDTETLIAVNELEVIKNNLRREITR